ncbi:hypothetical protein MIMGU_mgv1a026624mg [Erythranthe guttata]|uniref:3'-5' exonuclease domain-containing protein n=1 Tax=Erythranthe guttata TaxID=4155 RepID=A0A022Q5C1_ERYGU|nr:hypothetical protein MIMGU_mgv1a026624mg [Erythranthe guttata]
MEMQIKELEVAFGSHKSYSVFVDNNEIETLVTHDHAMVRKWVNSTENSNRCRLNRLILITIYVKMLFNDHGLRVMNTGDIPSWAVDELGMETLRGAGLKTLVKCILGKDMQKPKTIAMSEWDKLELEQDQVAYAWLDAYFSFEIGRQLSAWY